MIAANGKFSGPALPCVCATVRRAARAVSQVYAGHLRPQGTDPSQFAMLQMVKAAPGRSQVALTAMLDMDKTTLSRNVKLLKSKRLVEAKPVAGQREEGYFLTPMGEEHLKAANPSWSRAQAELRSVMTAEEWETMCRGLEIATRAARRLLHANATESPQRI